MTQYNHVAHLINKLCVGSYFGQYLGPNGNKDFEPPRSFLLVVWWTRLGSPQLYWANYELSCAQNMGPTTHTHSYMQIYTYCKINCWGTVKKIKKKQVRTSRILRRWSGMSLYQVFNTLVPIFTGISHNVQISSKVIDLDSSL